MIYYRDFDAVNKNTLFNIYFPHLHSWQIRDLAKNTLFVRELPKSCHRLFLKAVLKTNHKLQMAFRFQLIWGIFYIFYFKQVIYLSPTSFVFNTQKISIPIKIYTLDERAFTKMAKSHQVGYYITRNDFINTLRVFEHSEITLKDTGHC